MWSAVAGKSIGFSAAGGRANSPYFGRVVAPNNREIERGHSASNVPLCGKMEHPMSDRTFTLDEAQSLLPVLESLLRTAISSKKILEEAEAEQQALAHKIFLNGGTFVDVVPLARRKAERIKAEQRAKDALAEIDSIGVQVKDIDIGLLDFPCEVEGQIVLLCWKMGEKSITHWHGTEEGFAGRKPIDERIARARKAN